MFGVYNELNELKMFSRAPAKKSKMYLGPCQLSLMELLLPKYLTDFSRSLFPQKSSLIDV